jgi:hypothetical protein
MSEFRTMRSLAEKPVFVVLGYRLTRLLGTGEGEEIYT